MGWRDLMTGIPTEDRFTALDNVSVEVAKGEIVGILGRNGAGKSTLLRLMAGIYTPDLGSIALAGDVAGLFELGGFGSMQLTGREFAARYLQFFGVSKSMWQEVLDDIHQFSELGDYFEEKIRTYSSGMGARLYFSVATAIPHDIYLIDEILSVGDEHFQLKSWARMRERLSAGASGLLVTHDWSAVIKLCRTSKVLQSGGVVCDGRSDLVVAAYLDLPKPDATRARLNVDESVVMEAVSGESCMMHFEVEVLHPGTVELSVSIEALQLGVGWEPVILTEYRPLTSIVGRVQVVLVIEHLPLAPGDYLVSLFLAAPPATGTGVRAALDVRGWTYGNGITLRVTGREGDGLAPFPVHWSGTSL